MPNTKRSGQNISKYLPAILLNTNYIAIYCISPIEKAKNRVLKAKLSSDGDSDLECNKLCCTPYIFFKLCIYTGSNIFKVVISI